MGEREALEGIGRRLREARLDARYSLRLATRELEKRWSVSISASSLQRGEQGKQAVDAHVLAALAKLYEADHAWILTGEREGEE